MTDNEDKRQIETTALSMLGVNRSQARDSLSAFAAERREAQQQQEIRRMETPEEPFRPITSTVATLERRQIRSAQPVPAASSTRGGSPIEVSGVLNGEYTTKFLLEA